MRRVSQPWPLEFGQNGARKKGGESEESLVHSLQTRKARYWIVFTVLTRGKPDVWGTD
jgi:hypothetical protein